MRFPAGVSTSTPSISAPTPITVVHFVPSTTPRAAPITASTGMGGTRAAIGAAKSSATAPSVSPRPSVSL
jgi:hypothetical protein